MIVGVTGCPGSGKSLFAAEMVECGWALVDADKMGREIVEMDKGLLEKLAEAFGRDIIDADGRLDRRLLASRAFADRDATLRLNEIVHPRLVSVLLSQLNGIRKSGRNAVVDCALVYEWGIESSFDVMVCVVADATLRRRRIWERDGRSSREIDDLFAAQLSQDKKAAKSDITVKNDSLPERLTMFGRMAASLSGAGKGERI